MNKRIFSAMILGFLLTLILSGFAGFTDTCRELRRDTIRLHVLANSDTEDDQALKLKVRDAVLAQANALYEAELEKGGEVNKARMEKAIAQELPHLQEAAAAAILDEGYAYPVSVALKDQYFATRDYDRFTLPAGKYRSLQVVIGEGAGKNWWCVAFPPLCLSAASEDSAMAVFSAEENRVITHPARYRVKFAAVELIESVKEKLFG